MRLSDAIALGRTLVSPVEGGTNRREGGPGKGCALDMAVIAAKGRGNWHDASDIWNWLDEIEPERAHLKDCREVKWSIITKFDFNVMHAKDMTLDQLIDYVRFVEPEEKELDNVEQEEVEYASIT